MIMTRPLCACLLSAGLLSSLSARAGQEKPSLVKGPDTVFFGETITSEYELGEDFKLAKIQLTLPAGIIHKAMLQPWANHIIDLPDTFKNSSLVQNIMIDWNPAGHEPPGVYDVPHFDFHFYFISKERVSAIDCSDRTPIPANLIPEGYVLPPLDAPTACVPKMGVHAVPLQDLGPDQTFVETPIYGYYEGQLIFFEPMITHKHLASGHAVEQEIKLPAAFLSKVQDKFVPTHFRTRFDVQTQTYLLTLSK